MNASTYGVVLSVGPLERIRRCDTIILFLLFAMFAVSGCASRIGVYSDPPGARVLLNEVDTGTTTPTEIRTKDFPVGRSTIKVEKEGYVTVPKKQVVEVRTSVGNILWSWWPPVLIKNLAGDKWKGITRPHSRRLKEFRLDEIEDVASPDRTSGGDVR